MSIKFQSARGVADILPSEIDLWHRIENNARSMLEAFGYTEIRTPVFEHTGLFARGIGEETDIVSKEMYTFSDRKGQLLTLRPEGTAPVVRAYLQHNLRMDFGANKLYYLGPMFRYERPQAGRTRQFHQIGAECFGPPDPEVDAEQIILLFHLLERLAIKGTASLSKEACGHFQYSFFRQSSHTVTSPPKEAGGYFQIHLNSLGCRSCHIRYRDELRKYLAPFVHKLCDDCKSRFNSNTLRVLDCKNPDCKSMMKDSPRVLDFLCHDCDGHFSGVKGLLKDAGIQYYLNPHLVRGLDYYTRTTFEVTSHLLGAQNAVAGGGRYDHLVEDFGGPSTPACGFALGMERLILALKGISQPKDKGRVCFSFFATLGSEARSKAFRLMTKLRLHGVPAEMDYQGRTLKSQIRMADRLGSVYTIIFGEEEISRGSVILRQMGTGYQEECTIDEISDILMRRHASWLESYKEMHG
ncbi:histidine--tRNA ligase [bacterium]|nr:histidine--tRNA ligase [bacterium]